MIKTDVIKIGEASKLLGVSVATMRKWEVTGEVAPLRKSLSGTRYYSRSAITAKITTEAEGEKLEGLLAAN